MAEGSALAEQFTRETYASYLPYSKNLMDRALIVVSPRRVTVVDPRPTGSCQQGTDSARDVTARQRSRQIDWLAGHHAQLRRRR